MTITELYDQVRADIAERTDTMPFVSVTHGIFGSHAAVHDTFRLSVEWQGKWLSIDSASNAADALERFRATCLPEIDRALGLYCGHDLLAMGM